MKKLDTEGSKRLYEEAQKYLLNGMASYFHKSDVEEYPICITHGSGSKVYDVDGNEYIDYVGGLGPMLLGYQPQEVLEAVSRQLDKGSHFSAVTPETLELSRLLTEVIPCAECVSYQSSGTEADMFAVRVARAYTGKMKLIKFESTYHGWSDELKVSVDAEDESLLGDRTHPEKYITTKGQRREASDDVMILPFNDYELLEKTVMEQKDELAAIIMEPFICDSGPIPPLPGYLDKVRKLTQETGVVLIFDEVITGFRLALGGAQEYFGVTPDLAVFAKAVTAGFPLSVVAGKKEIMESGAKASGTFNGNPVVTAAAMAALGIYQKKETYEHLQSIGELFVEGIQELSGKYGIPMYAGAYGGMVQWTVGMDRTPVDFRDWLKNSDVELYNRIFLRARDYGVRFTDRRGRVCLTTEHTGADIRRTMEVLDLVLSEIAKEA